MKIEVTVTYTEEFTVDVDDATYKRAYIDGAPEEWASEASDLWLQAIAEVDAVIMRHPNWLAAMPFGLTIEKVEHAPKTTNEPTNEPTKDVE